MPTGILSSVGLAKNVAAITDCDKVGHMSYRINGKNLSVGRLMVRGKEADKRLKYIHVGPKGTSVVTPNLVARVSLANYEPESSVPEIIPQSEIDALPRIPIGSEDSVELAKGLPAVTQPEYLVPQIDKCFPDPEDQTAVFTCNGDILRKMLTVACEVSKDSDKTLRLRLCGNTNTLRIDTYRQPGDQEFCGVMKGMEYDGSYIPGEPTGTTKPEIKPVQRAIGLKINVGRRFRGDGE